MYENILLIMGFTVVGLNHYILKKMEENYQKHLKAYTFSKVLFPIILLLLIVLLFMKFEWYYGILLTIGGMIGGGVLAGTITLLSKIFKTPIFTLVLSIVIITLLIVQIIIR